MEREVLIGIITASSALGGVVVSQAFSLLQTRFEHKHQKKILLRTKYEELVQHLNEAIEWGRETTFCKTQGELHARAVPLPARRVYSLALLYFPKLKESAAQLVHACVALHHVLSENFTETEMGTADGPATTRAESTYRLCRRLAVMVFPGATSNVAGVDNALDCCYH